MKTIRYDVYETNSSSCHVVTICSKNKLEEFMDCKVIVAHTFDFWKNEHSEDIIPDSDFIPIEDAYNRLVSYLESYNDTDPSFTNDAKAILHAGKLTFENFKKCITDDEYFKFEAEGCDSLDAWSFREVLREAFGGKSIFWNDGDNGSNPFLMREISKENLKGIGGPAISVLRGNLNC